jgi:alkylhydroperoxidase family enzyme
MNELTPREGPYDGKTEALLQHYPRRGGYLLSLFRVFANSHRFLRKGVADLLDRDSPLSLRQREVVILRVTANNACAYEWGVHVAAFAARAGLNEEQVDATWGAPAGSPCWDEDDALLLLVVDELCATGTMTDATLQRLRARFDCEAQLEILALCGNYHTISFVANVARLPAEPFAVRSPPGAVVNPS